MRNQPKNPKFGAEVFIVELDEMFGPTPVNTKYGIFSNKDMYSADDLDAQLMARLTNPRS